jgi:hypothetical protein
LDSHHITQNTVIPHGVDRNVFPAPDAPREIVGNKIVLGFVSKRYPRGIKGETRLFSLFD